MSLSRVALPCELWDAIIDHLHDDAAALCASALVCRSWVPASRFHRFEEISLSQKSGFRAARLNALLASPCGTIAPAVQSLTFPDALAPIQIRNPGTGQVFIKTLLELVPRATQLQHVRALTLSDLPWPLLRSLKNVQELTLTRVCIGQCLVDVVAVLPELRRLTLDGVTAVPYRGHLDVGGGDAPTTRLDTVTIRGSSIAFLGWLALAAPHARALSITDLAPRDLEYLLAYVNAVGPELETLDLAFYGGNFDEVLLPPLLAPCTSLQILRLHFSAPCDVERFFAFGGVFAHHPCPLQIVVPASSDVAAMNDFSFIQEGLVSFVCSQ
ncbi:hypothetical protein DFH07DRAFT_1063907 [Mycena maculata]|uniref:F-box domain-containing protein n=1 Tax=Mycena maculata TaxID=230809 RepID=A0AAD7IFA2_9AGAR|nr:hypothetical protein DFH07DRAFT_1063907 [Mycena maculata]